MTTTMQAIVLSEPGPVENLEMKHLPLPEPPSGWVRIAVQAFGLNRSELHTRLGLAEGVTFPRVLGIECVGTIDTAPDSDLHPGQQVAAMMGGMGRTFDGGYAQYTIVPRSLVIPFHSDLPREILGALPETLQTAYGSLTTGLDLRSGQTLLIRGGTSALGRQRPLWRRIWARPSFLRPVVLTAFKPLRFMASIMSLWILDRLPLLYDTSCPMVLMPR
jgi:NADPH:quinone reductase-like Zn-dependent oxidoreductase